VISKERGLSEVAIFYLQLAELEIANSKSTTLTYTKQNKKTKQN
jgi:hypothetical protein